MRLLIAIDKNEGIESPLSSHFGHCQFFAIYETETKELNFVKNELIHTDETLSPVDQIMIHEPEIVFSLGIGRKAIDLFNEKKVELKTGEYKTVKEVIDNIANLKNLDKNCQQ
jgi:predicted Fe-Mo cluster-binding NifX family protein